VERSPFLDETEPTTTSVIRESMISHRQSINVTIPQNPSILLKLVILAIIKLVFSSRVPCTKHSRVISADRLLFFNFIITYFLVLIHFADFYASTGLMQWRLLRFH